MWIRLPALFAAALLLAVPAHAQQPNDGRVELSPSQARLIVAPYAFGSRRIDRSVIASEAARYEIWTTEFDFERRFFHIVLRENTPFRVIRDEMNIESAVRSMWPPGFASIRFSDEKVETVDSRLGTARYQRFTATGSGVIGADGKPVGPARSTACAGFILPFGAEYGDFPGNTIQGLYCDPAELSLPTFDIEGTLQAIGVKGIYKP